MTEIIRGTLTYDNITKRARGGTELMAERMVRDIPQEVLSDWQIVHSRVRDLDPNLKKLLVLHDLPNDSESEKLSDPDFRSNFKKIVAVSDWQLQSYNSVKGLPYSESLVIHNGIEPIDARPKIDDGKVHLVYHTTPHRGLVILIPVFEALVKIFPDIHLHVYSSFEIYGWEERNKPYEQLFHVAKNHPNISYYGTVSNEHIREVLPTYDIFAYPCIWPETSCLAAIEAFSAGLTVVAPNYAGLTDTCARWGDTYQWHEDPNLHAEIFFHRLYSTIVKYKNNRLSIENYIAAQKNYFDSFYNWNNIKHEWIGLLESF